MYNTLIFKLNRTIIINMNNLNKNFNNLTLLYIEDETNIRDSLTNSLKILFKKVYAIENAELAIKVYKSKHIDMILSDIGLPGMSGIDLVKIIRKENKDIPIILLTAYTQTDILLEAVKLKLVSYLTKPISFDTLSKALLDAREEISEPIENIFEITKNIQYDIDRKILSQDAKDLHITASEDRLLNIFIENKDRTLSAQEIKNLLWDDSYHATDTALKSVLNKLRKKIGTDRIKNISGIGYYLET